VGLEARYLMHDAAATRLDPCKISGKFTIVRWYSEHADRYYGTAGETRGAPRGQGGSTYNGVNVHVNNGHLRFVCYVVFLLMGQILEFWLSADAR
jgi:hypothetical protein